MERDGASDPNGDARRPDAIDRFQLVERLFHDARRVPPAERAALVRRRSGSDEELAREVLSLLAKESQDVLPVDDPVAHLPSDLFERACRGEFASATPAKIGRYRITRLLGRGGMGVVYEAEQDVPRRAVALKLIDARIASPETLRRFRNEVEILGGLHHPGIAQIHDAGTLQTPFGDQPYFTMELIDGVPITEYAVRESLSNEERLELVAEVCDAIHSAHERGVVHRDLKPSNILIDVNGRARVLDFGVARAGLGGTDADGSSVLTTMHTSPGQLVGTMAYMSPEHASARTDAIDRRSDVYSLGVIAYELLTSRRPTVTEDRMFDEAIRAIREEDATPVGFYDRRLRGDVETIIETALAKDPERRYPSAAAMAEDIRRALAHQPITARRIGRLERSARFCRRHRALVGGVVIGALLLLSGLIVAVREAGLARDAEAIAEERRVVAERRTEESARMAYRAGLAAAFGEITMRDVRGAARRLDGLSEKQRGWEWDHLVERLDDAIASFRGASPIVAAALSSDGTLLTTVDARGDLLVRTVPAGEVRRRIELGRAIQTAVFDREGTTLVALIAEDRRNVARWRFDREGVPIDHHDDPAARAASDVEVTELPTLERAAVRVATSEHGRTIAVQVGAASFRWIRDGAADWSALVANGYVQQFVVLHDEDGLLASEEWRVQRLPFDPEEQTHVIEDRNCGLAAALAPVGTHAIVGGTNRSAHVVDLERLQRDSDAALVQRLPGHAGRVDAVAWSADGQTVVSHGREGALLVHDLDGAREPWAALTVGLRRPTLRVDAEGTRMSALADGIVRIYERGRRAGIDELPHEGFVYSVAFSPDGSQVATASWDGTLRIWETASGRLRLRIATERAYVTTVAYSPDGRLIATGHHVGPGRPAPLCLWDAHTGALVRELPSGPGETLGTAFSPDGRSIAVARGHAPATILDLTTGETIATVQPPRGRARSVDWSPDGRLLAVGTDEGEIVLWRGVAHEPVVLGTAAGMIHECRFDPSGTRLATTSRGRDVTVWSVAAGDRLVTMRGHTELVYGVAWSPDGRRLATGSSDTTVRIWDADTGDELLRLDGHDDYVHAVAFSSDGSTVASASGDHTARLWRARGDEHR